MLDGPEQTGGQPGKTGVLPRAAATPEISRHPYFTTMNDQENQQSAVLTRAAERLAALKPGPRMYLEIRTIAAELDVLACCLAQAEREAGATK